MRPLLVVGLLVSMLDASAVVSVRDDDLDKRVLLKLKDGKELEAPRSDGHRWQLDPAVSADRKAIGWLVTFDEDAKTPKGLAVLRGQELRTLDVKRMIWRWGFYKDSVVLALGPEQPHEPAEYVMYSLSNFEKRASMKRFELNEYDAEWAHAARLRTRLE